VEAGLRPHGCRTGLPLVDGAAQGCAALLILFRQPTRMTGEKTVDESNPVGEHETEGKA
jgi:hypothetical protein